MTPTSSTTSGQATSGALPCDVGQILSTKCQACHGASPTNGAPMPLVTAADLSAPAKSNAMLKVYELVLMRVQDKARPMPPDPTQHLSDAQIATLQTWATAGAKPGAACTAAGGGAAGSGPAAGSGSTPTTMATAGAGSVAPPNDADIEKCYELRAHGQSMPGDTTKYTAPPGETYTSFIFKAPWTTPVQGLRFRHLADNMAVLHHWLLYSETDTSKSDGDVDECQLAGPTGFLCGAATTRALITGWAPGRGDFSLPGDVGLELPKPGELMAVEFHYYNQGDSPAQDQSGPEICVTSKFRPNTASVSWLGTETINVPANSKGDASGTCTPSRKGMNSTDPIHILFSWPHEHKAGRHLKSIVNRASGMKETLIDGEFSFEYQVLHDTPLLLNPGDTVTTTCSYENTTPAAIGFGQSTTAEMCFNFTYAWPAHALDNPSSTIGASTNSCF